MLFDYINPTRAEWPASDYIVGNPPFIGASRMRDALGDGYTESLRKAWKGKVPESADFVMYWWHRAAEHLAAKSILRFGLITTNSIHQTFNRRVLEPFLAEEKKPIHLAYAIPDHPWVDSADGAAVRIAMTIADSGKREGFIDQVAEEHAREDGENEVTLVRSGGLIAPNLQIGADVSSAVTLQANSKISCPGVKLHGSGFIITEEALEKLGSESAESVHKVIKGYRNGRDLTNRPRGVKVIDLFGLSESEARETFPSIYQHVLTTVKPERDQNNRDTYRINWWIFGEPRRDFRPALARLPRYIATVETSKHRFFTFLDESILPDNKLIAIASDDSFVLGVLSSSVHIVWSLASGSWLGVGNDSVYVKTRCFEPFPFPALEESPLKQHIRDLGEKLDAHRKARQAAHPDLTLTGIYNVLEKLRAGESLADKDRKIHDQGLVTILKQIHDDLDAAVFEAYGWQDLSRSVGVSPTSGENACGRDAHTPCEELLKRLVALNHERAAEEKRGLVRWLRPDYQAPNEKPVPQATQDEIALDAGKTASVATLPDKLAWPTSLPEQVAALHKLLPTLGPDPDALAAAFGKRTKSRVARISEILETLKTLGKL